MSETGRELAILDAEYRVIGPTETPESFETKLLALREFTKRNLTDGVDYGKIPGTPKPTLLKPGAEKLLRWYGLAVDITILPSSAIDVMGAVLDIDVEGTVRHPASRMILGTVHANANSEERRYKNARQNGQQTLADQKNTILKMADKRLIVAAALLYTGASEAYTQDKEDAAPAAETSHQPEGEGNCPTCHKGNLVLKEGIAKKTGKPYKMWVCDAGSWDPETKTKIGCEHVQNEAPAEKTPDTPADPAVEAPADAEGAETPSEEAEEKATFVGILEAAIPLPAARLKFVRDWCAANSVPPPASDKKIGDLSLDALRQIVEEARKATT